MKKKSYVSIVAFSQIVREIMFDILGKLLLEFWIEFEYFDETRNVETLEITVSEGTDITTGFYNDVIVVSSTF